VNLLDIRTILIGFVISDAICALIISSLWRQCRRSSRGHGLWTASFVLQPVSVLLIAPRGPGGVYGYEFGLAV
jgi:hypothetical protein